MAEYKLLTEWEYEEPDAIVHADEKCISLMVPEWESKYCVFLQNNVHMST